MDPVTRTTSLLPLPKGRDANCPGSWDGSLVVGSDGAMYAAPFNATGVLRVDPATCTTSLLAADDDDESKPKPKTKPKTAHKTKKAATPKPTKAIKKKPIKLVRA